MKTIASPEANDPSYALRYYVLYYVSFLCLFLALFVLRSVCLGVGYSDAASTIAPAAFAPFIPILQSGGGYFYDFSELLLMAAFVWVCVRGVFLAGLPLSALAVFNKESFLFFLVALYPFLRLRHSRRTSLVAVGAFIALGGTVYHALRSAYGGNPGTAVEVHFLGNVLFYVNPVNLFLREVTYGIFMFRGYSIVTVLMAAAIVWGGWSGLTAAVRRHIALAAAINLPLFIVFGSPGEVRNLSMLFVGSVLLIAQNLSQWIGGRPPAAAGFPVASDAQHRQPMAPGGPPRTARGG